MKQEHRILDLTGVKTIHSKYYIGPDIPIKKVIIESKKKGIAKAVNERDWNRFIYSHERPYRFEAFKKIEKQLTDQEHWEVLGKIWTDSENIWQHQKDWYRVLASRKSAASRSPGKFSSVTS